MLKKIGLFFCGLIFSGCVFAEQSICKNRSCMGVVDAGSTGTRLFLYSYEHNQSGEPIQIKEEWSKKVTPGLASLDLKSGKIEPYLNDLFSASFESQIPVYFYATAGMRLLPRNTQEAYYASVSDWFSHHATNWNLKEAKTITGKEEGVFGWTAAAYRLNALTGEEGQSIGLLDTGGASVQIVFPLHETADVPSARLAHVSLYNHSYTLYAYSALGLGQTLVAQHFLNHPACYPYGYILADDTQALGNALFCAQDITHLLNDVHHVNDEVSAFANKESRTWYAMGGIVYASRHPLFDLDTSFTSNDLLKSADEKACSRSWNDVVSLAPDDASSACFLGAYYYALVTEGYGLNGDEAIHSTEASWTLGVVLLNR